MLCFNAVCILFLYLSLFFSFVSGQLSTLPYIHSSWQFMVRTKYVWLLFSLHILHHNLTFINVMVNYLYVTGPRDSTTISLYSLTPSSPTFISSLLLLSILSVFCSCLATSPLRVVRHAACFWDNLAVIKWNTLMKCNPGLVRLKEIYCLDGSLSESLTLFSLWECLSGNERTQRKIWCFVDVKSLHCLHVCCHTCKKHVLFPEMFCPDLF